MFRMLGCTCHDVIKPLSMSVSGIRMHRRTQNIAGEARISKKNQRQYHYTTIIICEELKKKFLKMKDKIKPNRDLSKSEHFKKYQKAAAQEKCFKAYFSSVYEI